MVGFVDNDGDSYGYYQKMGLSIGCYFILGLGHQPKIHPLHQKYDCSYFKSKHFFNLLIVIEFTDFPF